MRDNVIPFPKQATSKKDDAGVVSGECQMVEKSWDELRHAFDEARKHWPLEMSELPEQNRKRVASRKQ